VKEKVNWERKSLNSNNVDSFLILGSSYDPGYPAIVLTFSVTPNE